jgi:hypothetical protein
MLTPLLADMGIPMIFGQWILMACALVPVIVLETLVVSRAVPLRPGRAVGGVVAANIASTLVGVPLAWVAALAIEFAVALPVDIAAMRWHWPSDSPFLTAINFVFGAAWLGPLGKNSVWVIYFAAAVLLIPCFFASVLIERRVCARIWRHSDQLAVRRAVLQANIYSYTALLLFMCTWSAWSFHSTHRRNASNKAMERTASRENNRFMAAPHLCLVAVRGVARSRSSCSR